MSVKPEKWDLEVDFVAVGSGGGAITGAIASHDLGKKAVVLEKAPKLGGVTAYSGGEIFLANNHVMQRESMPDSFEAGRAYQDFLSGGYNDPEMLEVITWITDPKTILTTSAERVFLKTIEGGCQVPVACYSVVDNEDITLTGLVASVDGFKLLKESVTCSIENANENARDLAQKLLSAGGREILGQIR